MSESKPPQRRILVVDDDPDIRENLYDILTDVGFEVTTAADAASALAIVRVRAIDVALLDLKMPGEDGLSLARKLKGLACGVVPIIVTAYAGGASTDEISSSGAWRVLNKPIHLPTLLSLVGEAAEQPLVMVVDDDRALCLNLWDILRDQGYRVGWVHDHLTFGPAIGSTAPSVVLIDMRLPDGDGLAVLKQLREVDPDVKAIVITGYPIELNLLVEQAKSEGVDGVYTQPFDVPSLLALVENLAN